ncbi:hypothetical protein FOT62_24750 [Serratia marcescens]|uniref:Uncharacterized protein n=1 Tax=Serratia marcescens TaxID=615 RepID=A0A5C7BNJ1_SERMA|nr:MULTISPECIES: hypothetical protein [Serratia]TXE24476.1 hypothetical protein FOT62_24750 [Serratia marcescens]TXE53312.1 hypothetical protein FOT56_27185 [Serratia marcescens]
MGEIAIGVSAALFSFWRVSFWFFFTPPDGRAFFSAPVSLFFSLFAGAFIFPVYFFASLLLYCACVKRRHLPAFCFFHLSAFLLFPLPDRPRQAALG